MAVRALIVLTSNDRRGAEVEGSQLAAELNDAGVDARVVALRGGSADPIDVVALGERPLSFTVLRSLRRLAADVDVVVAFGSTTLPACAIALLGRRTPFVYRSIGDPARWVRGRVHRWRTGLLFCRATHVIALWPAAAAAIETLYGVRAGRVSCIPNARPPAAAPTESQVAARESFGLPTDGHVVVWVGALSPEKRPVAAVEAVAALPETWLLMAGEGVLRDEVQAACDRLLPGRHRLVGVVAPLEPVWAAADVVLLTSATEGMPGVLIEAALHGVPAVATDVGAVRSVVVDGVSGVVVDAGSSSGSFAAALAIGFEHRAQWGAAAREHATTTFTWSEVVPRWVALIERLGKPLG